MTKVPAKPNIWAKNIFMIKGKESSIAYISELKRLRIRPIGVVSKNFTGAYKKKYKKTYRPITW